MILRPLGLFGRLGPFFIVHQLTKRDGRGHAEFL